MTRHVPTAGFFNEAGSTDAETASVMVGTHAGPRVTGRSAWCETSGAPCAEQVRMTQSDQGPM